MSSLVWIGLVDAVSARPTAAEAWRDQTLLPRVAALPGVQKTQLYSAFNTGQVALFAQLAAGSEGQAAVALPEPPGCRLRQDLARLASEVRQPGTRDQDDEALLYTVRFTVPDDWTDEFDRWYDEEHVPMIYGCRYWSMTRRYRFIQAGPGAATHFAMHYLSDARGFDAPELRAARLTPWRNRLVGQSWFTDVEKMIYFRQTPPLQSP